MGNSFRLVLNNYILQEKKILENIFSPILVSSDLNILSEGRVFESVACFCLLNSELQSFKFSFQYNVLF